MDAALQQRVELRELWRAHMRNKGRYGSPAARRLLCKPQTMVRTPRPSGC